MDKTLRLEVRFKNARLYNAIAERATPLSDRARAFTFAKPVKAFCELHQINLNETYRLLNLRHSPWKPDGTLTTVAQKLAEALEADPLWLFPKDLYARELEPLVGEVDHKMFLPLSAIPPMALLTDPTQDQVFEHQALQRGIASVLETLTPREERVIRARYFKEQTYDAIAHDEGLTRERVRQIEAKAFRKFRHPSRMRLLRP